MQWTISIDTGGTFTDGIGISPTGELLRLKVLSNGALRARILRKINDHTYIIDSVQELSSNILVGYKLRDISKETFAVIKEFNLGSSEIVLDKELPLSVNDLIEISANEEAPILLARLMTKTFLHEPLPAIHFKIGTTKGTNALLERKGAKVLLILTKGFKDLTKIGTQSRPHLFQLDIPDPIYFFSDVVEVDERILATGDIYKPLTNDRIDALLYTIQKLKPEAIAVSFCNAYKNNKHESQLVNALKKQFSIPISVGSELEPIITYLFRTRTTTIDAYLSPILTSFIQNINRKSPEAKIELMKSDGGLSSTNNFSAKDSLLSGPAGGLLGAKHIAQKYGETKLISFDMGGTSTDVGRFDKSKDLSFINKIGGVELLLPLLAIETVAAGGGSICKIMDGILQLGPESAGAYPGPACYGAGGQLTLTDVNYLLGKMSEKMMRIPLQKKESLEAFRRLLSSLAKKPDLKVAEEILQGFIQIAVEKMAVAIQKISLKKGINPAEYTLIAFGGAGGLHACQLAEQLNIRRILIPYNAGILSAEGILHSKKEAIIQFQGMLLLDEVIRKLPSLIDELTNKGKQQLIKDGADQENIFVKEIRLYLRLVGQENAIEIFYKEGVELKNAFIKSYINIYNYKPTDPNIELESIRILISEKEEKINKLKLPAKTKKPRPHFKQTAIVNPGLTYDGYLWNKLKEGDEIIGPALVLNENASIFLEQGWTLTTTKTKDLFATKQSVETNTNNFKQEAILLELFQNRFQAIAEGMGAQLQRTAMSINIRERLDFSCAVLDANGDLIVNAPHIPVHLGSLGFCAKMILQKFSLNQGDIILTNHPAFGGSHLPDLTLMAPVFDNDDNLIAYVLNRAHHAEIGGLRPGSMSPEAKNLEEEGVIFTPFYLAKRNKYYWRELKDKLKSGKYPSRRVEENIADLKSAVASLKYGQDKMKDLAAKYGSKDIKKYMDKILDRSDKIMSQLIADYKSFDNTSEEYLDDGHRIRLRIQVIEDQLCFDFSGSSKVHSGNLNANKSIIYSAVMYTLRLLAIEDIPLNDGLMRKVKLILPESFLSPDFSNNSETSPAVAGGNTEVSQRVVDSIIKCFGLSACSQGTMNNLLFGNEKYSYYETIGGGVGAGPGFKGRSGIHQHMTNTRITDPEYLEYRFPVVLKEFSIRTHSGGKGKWKGGDGLVRRIEFLEDMEITILSQHRNEAPYGLQGGQNGKEGRQFVVRNSGKTEELKGMDQTEVQAGDSICIKTPGGGGYGTIEKLNKHD